jgi:hypothetical protein
MASQQKTVIKVPKDLSPSERIELSEDIINFIRLRTQNGTGFRPGTGRNYSLSNKPYTKDYAKKKGSSFVDLTLSTEMLESMKLLTQKSGSITIGYDKGDKINGKVEGNQIGSYGRSPNPKKARPFLGISNKDLETLMDALDDSN